MTDNVFAVSDSARLPAVVECVVFSEVGGQTRVALTQATPASREEGHWMLPAEVPLEQESLEDAARRQLVEWIQLPEGNQNKIRLLQLEGRMIEREPGHAVAAHPLIVVLSEKLLDVVLRAGNNHASWFPVDKLPPLICDHAKVIGKALKASKRAWHCYRYPRPMVAADCVVFSIMEDSLHVVLIQRGHTTEKAKWALPGGFLRENEPPRSAAKRELFEETGIVDKSLAEQPLEEVGTYGDPGRDPRGWVISTAFMTLIPMDRIELVAGTDAAKAEWFSMNDLPDLAFDHMQILQDAYTRLAGLVSVDLSPKAEVVFGLLPDVFTKAQAQHLFEIISRRKLDRGNFHKWIDKYWDLENTGEKASSSGGAPPALYRLIGLKG